MEHRSPQAIATTPTELSALKVASTALPKSDISTPLSRPTKVGPLTPNVDILAQPTVVSIGTARGVDAKACLARFQARKSHDGHTPVAVATKKTSKTFSSRIKSILPRSVRSRAPTPD